LSDECRDGTIRSRDPHPPAVHRLSLPTPFPVGPVNAYVLEGPPLTLIDPGPAYEPARQALTRGLRELGLAIGDIERVVVTHPHIDHYGLAAEVVEASGAPVVVHTEARSRLGSSLHQGLEGERAALEEVLARAGVPAEFGQALYSTWAKADSLARPVEAGRLVEEGDIVEGGGVAWRVLHTPGHSPASLCLYDEKAGRLISGDTLLAHISSNAIVEFRPARGREGDAAGGREPGGLVREKSLVVYLASLRRLAALEVREVFPGHGRPFTGHREIISKRMAHYESRKAAISRVLEETGPAPAFHIASVLFPDEVGVMGRFLALSEVLGHLDLLEADGRVTRGLNGVVDLYFPA